MIRTISAEFIERIIKMIAGGVACAVGVVVLIAGALILWALITLKMEGKI